MSDHPARPRAPRWLLGGGAMGAAVREFEWSKTPLGPVETWSHSLRTIVGVVLNSRQPMFLWWGPELIRIYNDAYLPSLGVGKHPTALGQRGRDCWPEIWPIIAPQIEAVMLRGQPSWHEDALVPIFRNGGIEDVYWTYGYSPVFDESNEIGGVLVVCTETTERVASSQRDQDARRLADLERERLLRFFEQAPAGICLVRGPDFVFDFVNEQYCRLVGRADLVGKPLLEALPELNGQGFDVLLRNVVASNEVFVGREVPVKLAAEAGNLESLSDFYVDFIYSPLRDLLDQVEGVAVFAIDVTAQVVARQRVEVERARAENANRAKDDFLATASHELRTPLNAILGWARLLRSGTLDEAKSRRGLATIERNAAAQVRLIEDILDGSRIIAGKLRLEKRALDLASLVRGALETVRLAATTKGITLEVDLGLGPAPVWGDAERLEQVLWNLCNNAVKFTPAAGIVAVRLTRSAAFVELCVADNGVGIETDFLPHVFDRFNQGRGATTRRHGGLGLGLALVRHLVEAHAGTVLAESEGPGRGATFRVTLPAETRIADPHEPARPSPDEPPLPPNVDLAGVHALVVDDESDARELLAVVLRGSGARVTLAASAREAFQALRAELPTILISDVAMPETDGYQLIHLVRTALDVNALQLPAIALTGYARAEDREKAVAAGFQAHVVKPVEPFDLLRTVANLLEGRKGAWP